MILTTLTDTQVWGLALAIIGAVGSMAGSVLVIMLGSVGWIFRRFVQHSDQQHSDNMLHQKEQDKAINQLNLTLSELLGYMRGKDEKVKTGTGAE